MQTDRQTDPPTTSALLRLLSEPKMLRIVTNTKSLVKVKVVFGQAPLIEDFDKNIIIKIVQTKYGIYPYLLKGEGVKIWTEISLYFLSLEGGGSLEG